MTTPVGQYDAINVALRPLVEEVTGDYEITLSNRAVPGGGRQLEVNIFPFDPQIAERARACVAEFGIEVREAVRGPRGGLLRSMAAAEMLPRFEIDGLVNARLWLDGFWPYVNDTLDIFVDEYEAEDLAPDAAARMALLARTFADRYVRVPQAWGARTWECLIAMSNYLEHAAHVTNDAVRVCL